MKLRSLAEKVKNPLQPLGVSFDMLFGKLRPHPGSKSLQVVISVCLSKPPARKILKLVGIVHKSVGAPERLLAFKDGLHQVLDVSHRASSIQHVLLNEICK